MVYSVQSVKDFVSTPYGKVITIGGGALALGGGSLAIVGALRSRRKKSGKKSKKKAKGKSYASRKKSKSYKRRTRRTPRTAGKGRDTSRKRIRYTKKGQPYVIMASGKARFIKKSSAKQSHRRKGGRY